MVAFLAEKLGKSPTEVGAWSVDDANLMMDWFAYKAKLESDAMKEAKRQASGAMPVRRSSP